MHTCMLNLRQLQECHSDTQHAKHFCSHRDLIISEHQWMNSEHSKQRRPKFLIRMLGKWVEFHRHCHQISKIPKQLWVCVSNSTSVCVWVHVKAWETQGCQLAAACRWRTNNMTGCVCLCVCERDLMARRVNGETDSVTECVAALSW